MAISPRDYSSLHALVVDGNPTSRSILVAQLRDFGVRNVVQCGRIVDARRNLEYRSFDFVLCELHFADENASGQDLLNDLRRNQLLPFSTVFIMVTGEATYTKVAEAAESALDGYLLKPHRASQLGERLLQARTRKLSLQAIFAAIEAGDFEGAANLCLQRFEQRGQFWLYAARVGAELLLRVGRTAEAQTLYEAVVAAKTLPWAKLGVARSMLSSGQPVAAANTLEKLIGEDPSYSDAYDVMGRAQFELGKFDQALATYKMASELTPSSISRLQNVGMLTFYAGDHAAAEKILDRVTLLGLESKLFDAQALVLMAFARLERKDHKGLQRCRHDFDRLLERDPDSPRNRRLSAVVDTLAHIQHHKIAQALVDVRTMVQEIKSPSFDFESASNLLTLLALLASHSIQLHEVDAVVDTLGMRFCVSRALSELLAGAAASHEPYVLRVRASHAQVLKFAEQAMTLSLRGDPTAAVTELIRHGESTFNDKLLETAHLVIDRYSAKIEGAKALASHVQALRDRCTRSAARAVLGEEKRQAGGLSLRVGRSPAPKASGGTADA